MKGNTILESLDDFSHEAVEPEPDRPTQTNPKPSLHQPQEIQLPIRAPTHFGFEGYRHWGLNE
jgi:hypothetical protein